jgi:hypothetical protein
LDLNLLKFQRQPEGHVKRQVSEKSQRRELLPVNEPMNRFSRL